jgi:ketosteroid isomerase-like protein
MTRISDRAEIEALFQKLARAHADHDACAIAEAYAPDAVIFDLAPPLGRRGWSRDDVAAWLAGWDGPIQIDARATSVLHSTATWRSCRPSAECAGVKAAKIRIRGTARPLVFRRKWGDGKSSATTRPLPSRWMGSYPAAVDLRP